jgi:D-beta-D-heptose 7-phosphate kinase/D-beta-D-heptose 1-phosphate adenosyltransferase
MFLVVGECCDDVFIYGDCKRICPEAPVPVFNPIETQKNHGMAGNVVANLTAMGAECDFVCNVEDIVKTRYVDMKTNQMLLRVDENDKASRITDEQLDYIFEMSGTVHAVIISDYNKGFLTVQDIENIASWYNYSFMDTKKILGSWADGVTFIKLNEVEYQANKNSIIDHDKLIVTLGAEGCRYKDKNYPVSEKIQTMDVSGAGDTFHSAFAVEYMKSKNIKKAINYAQKCTNTVIKKKGVATL